MKKQIGYVLSASLACLCAPTLVTALPVVAQQPDLFDMSLLEGEWALEGEVCANRKFAISEPDLYQMIEGNEITYDGRYIATETGFNLAEVQYTQPGNYSTAERYDVTEISAERFSLITYVQMNWWQEPEPHGPFTLVRC